MTTAVVILKTSAVPPLCPVHSERRRPPRSQRPTMEVSLAVAHNVLFWLLRPTYADQARSGYPHFGNHRQEAVSQSSRIHSGGGRHGGGCDDRRSGFGIGR